MFLISSLFGNIIKPAIFCTDTSNKCGVADSAGAFDWHLRLRKDDSHDLYKFLSSLQANTAGFAAPSQIEASDQQRKFVMEINSPSVDMLLLGHNAQQMIEISKMLKA